MPPIKSDPYRDRDYEARRDRAVAKAQFNMAIYDGLPRPVREALANAPLGAGTQVLVVTRNQVTTTNHRELAAHVRRQAAQQSKQQQHAMLDDLERNPIKWK